MQLTVNIGYDQLFELVRQLPPREKERFVKDITSSERNVSQSESESRPDLIVLERGEGYRIVQVPFPDTEEGRMREKELKRLQNEVRQRRSDISAQPERSREEWQQILSKMPTLDAEDVQGLEESMNNFRKEFNNAFERRCPGFVGSH